LPGDLQASELLARRAGELLLAAVRAASRSRWF
jgi:hypothetical protein